MKRALIAGVASQDGACLTEFLLGRGHEVHGIERPSSRFNVERVYQLYQDPHVTDATNLVRILAAGTAAARSGFLARRD